MSVSEAINEDLRATLQQILSDYYGTPCCITSLEHSPSEYRTSSALQQITVRLDSGVTLQLMWKDVSRAALCEQAQLAKPAFLYDPMREIKIYESILARSSLGTATYYGSAVEEAAGRYWLFIERVPGIELFQVGAPATWEAVARWLARMHAGFADSRPDPHRAHQIKYTRAFYTVWIERALSYLAASQRSQHQAPVTGARAVTTRQLRQLEQLAKHYGRVVDRLLSLPITLIHGEFYASNILVQEQSNGLRVCPVDWEMAAIGPGLVDLAALVAGNWTASQRTALALAYYDECSRLVGAIIFTRNFLEALTYCRLHIAVQWLGWSSNWAAPAQHAHDWLSEALDLSEKLGITEPDTA